MRDLRFIITIFILLLLAFLTSNCNYDKRAKVCVSTEAKWRHLPVKLHPKPELREDTIKSAKIWNETMNQTIFEVDELGGIVIQYGKVDNNQQQGLTTIDMDGFYIYGGVVNININQHPDNISLLVHELGHLIGIEHEDEGQEHTMSSHLANNSKRQEVDAWAQDRTNCLYK